ncbi:MAG: four helix bundle protein [Archangiaceae bacterium]|nr:four helix bundle protein [Archangiaceae bacterium]
MKTAAATLDHERLEVFRIARQCFVLVSPWLKRDMLRTIRDQFDRAMVSVLSNIAEGAGKTSKPDKRRSYEIAKGSTIEAAAQLEMMHIRGVITPTEFAEARTLLVRTARMLYGLCKGPREP